MAIGWWLSPVAAKEIENQFIGGHWPIAMSENNTQRHSHSWWRGVSHAGQLAVRVVNNLGGDCEVADQHRDSVRRLLSDRVRLAADIDSQPAHQSVDGLLLAAGCWLDATNRRSRVAHWLAYRLGNAAPWLVVLLLAEVINGGSARDVGACTVFRLRKLAGPDPFEAFFTPPSGHLRVLLEAIKQENAGI